MKRRNKVDEAGANARREVVNISDLMVSDVVTAAPEDTVAQVRQRMRERGIHALPVVNAEMEPVGIVTSTDLLDRPSDEEPIESCMTRNVYTIPVYSRIHDAARVMRNHRIHHLVVTNEGRIVGIISSFDLLKLVASKRFVMKEPASRPERGAGKRGKSEED